MNQLRTLFSDDAAVSPVIGVILMVAITVILAAVIGTFVLGLGDQVSQTAPTSTITFEDASGAIDDTAAAEAVFQIRHGGGDPIATDETELVVSGGISATADPMSSGFGGTLAISASGDFTTASTLTVSEAGSDTVAAGSTPYEITVTMVDKPSGQIVADETFEVA